MQTEAIRSPEKRAVYLHNCKHDPIWWFYSWVWTYDPRTKPAEQPFLLYPCQMRYVVDLVRHIDNGWDIVCEKSRDMGASWITLGVFDWMFWFRDEDKVPLAVMSRIRDLVDKLEDPDSLMWKLDFIHDSLPVWMKGNYAGRSKHRSLCHLFNPDTKNVIDGVSTTNEAMRGGRRLAMMIDEHGFLPDAESVMQATSDSMPCRVLVSTPNGRNHFYRERMSGKTVHTLMWWLHPKKVRGLYKVTDDGTATLIDNEFRGMVKVFPQGEVMFPDDYVLRTEAPLNPQGFRSPWYDFEDDRRASPRDMATNVDINYDRSGQGFFDTVLINKHRDQHQSDPWHIGELLWHMDHDKGIVRLGTVETVRKGQVGPFLDGGGRQRLKLWCELGYDGFPSWATNYSIGADIGYGVGASNSTLSVLDCTSGRKVAELVDNKTSPDGWARIAVALCRFFGGQMGAAFLAWEANGPGGIFGKAVLDLAYNHIYYHRDELQDDAKESRRHGWHSSKQSKAIILGEYSRALNRGEMINPSREALDECLEYIIYENGDIGVESLVEKSAAEREAHGDRVIGDALAWRGREEQPYAKSIIQPTGPAARRRDRERDQRKNEAWEP